MVPVEPSCLTHSIRSEGMQKVFCAINKGKERKMINHRITAITAVVTAVGASITWRKHHLAPRVRKTILR